MFGPAGKLAFDVIGVTFFLDFRDYVLYIFFACSLVFYKLCFKLVCDFGFTYPEA